MALTEHLFAAPVATQTPSPLPPSQRTLDDLGTALHEVTFVVIDLETTGGNVNECYITEIGAVKLRGGECLGTYQTLVDPGCAIPPQITVITGITQSMVMRAPRIETVLPSLIDFIGDAVVVGHNVRFDVSFVNAALLRDQRPRLANVTVDTLPLARRLIGPEVPNCKLGTLADRLNLRHTPTHRALDDALTTGDLLHFLLERAGALGVMGLDDLVTLPKMAGNSQAQKLRLTDELPRQPGVYLLKGRNGNVLYVGKASNLRSRVRSYFSTDQRRKVAQLLREFHHIDHQVCRNGLEAAVLEIRLIHEHLPRFNSQGTRSAKYPYIKLTLGERFPRLAIVRQVRDDGGLYLGPVSSAKRARLVIEAIETAVPIRRCTKASAKTSTGPSCTSAQLGVAACPCSGFTSEDDYRRVVDDLVEGLTVKPSTLLAPLEQRIEELAAEERYEEAADIRDRAEALSALLQRQRHFDRLRRAGHVQLRVGNAWAQLDDGLLSACGDVGDTPSLLNLHHGAAAGADVRIPLVAPSRGQADEILCIAQWLDKNASRVELDAVTGVLAEPLPRLRSFMPAKP